MQMKSVAADPRNVDAVIFGEVRPSGETGCYAATETQIGFRFHFLLAEIHIHVHRDAAVSRPGP